MRSSLILSFLADILEPVAAHTCVTQKTNLIMTFTKLQQVRENDQI